MTPITTMPEREDMTAQLRQNIRDHKGSYILQGLLFLIVGIVAAVLPGVTALSMELLMGLALLFSGFFQLLLSLHARIHWWAVLSALLSIVIGIFLLEKPFAGLFAIVAVVAFFLTAEGIFELLLAFTFRPLPNWGWMFFAGVISLALAVLLWAGFPMLSVMYLGWIIAANFIFYGISLLMLAGAVNSRV